MSEGDESDNGEDEDPAQAPVVPEPPPSGRRPKRDSKAPEKAGEKTPPKKKMQKK